MYFRSLLIAILAACAALFAGVAAAGADDPAPGTASAIEQPLCVAADGTVHVAPPGTPTGEPLACPPGYPPPVPPADPAPSDAQPTPAADPAAPAEQPAPAPAAATTEPSPTDPKTA